MYDYYVFAYLLDEKGCVPYGLPSGQKSGPFSTRDSAEAFARGMTANPHVYRVGIWSPGDPAFERERQ